MHATAHFESPRCRSPTAARSRLRQLPLASRLRGTVLVALFAFGPLLLPGLVVSYRSFCALRHSAGRGGRAAPELPATSRVKRIRSGNRVARRQVQQGKEAFFNENAASMYRKLSQRDHVLQRPDTYIGSTLIQTREQWVTIKASNASKSLVQASVNYAPGFLKIFDEILVNAMDQQFAEPRKGSRKKTSVIDVRLDTDTGWISIENDGYGIPVEKSDEYDAWIPSFIYGEMLTGSNFNDSSGPRFVGGRNGVGAKATNIFSKAFEVDIIDPATKLQFHQRWEDNMATRGDPEITKLEQKPSTGRVKVSYLPDYWRFGMKGLTKKTFRLLLARVWDAAACTDKSITLKFDGQPVRMQNFEQYSEFVYGNMKFVTHSPIKNKGEKEVRMEVSVGISHDGFKAVGFVNGLRCHEGFHIDNVVDQLVKYTKDRLSSKKTKVDGQALQINPAAVKEHLFVIVRTLVDNPVFESQSKERLGTEPKHFGFDPTLKSTFMEKVFYTLGLGKTVESLATFKQSEKQLKTMNKGLKKVSVPKLEDAKNAGKKGSHCTLILTEGDSAKAMALGGLESLENGRGNYGLYPLRGKVVNVFGKGSMSASENREVEDIVKIIGLQYRKTYSSTQELRYQRVMIFADQDLDGEHITGLIINLFSQLWPSLLEIEPNFICRFVTPLVKVQNYPDAQFFTSQEWDDWAKTHTSPVPQPKYYKGLGTSSDEEAAEYFSQLQKHTLQLQWQGEPDQRMVELAFGPNADARKEWLQHYDADAFLDYSRRSASHSEYFNLSFIHYSMYDCVRSIPNLMDGFKVVQRKIIHTALKDLKRETKVTVFANKVMAETKYHHGDVSVTEAVVRLAQTHWGTNNINYLQPHGQFGSRLHSREEHAGARYISVDIDPITLKIFRAEDQAVTEYAVDEMAEVEPTYFLPVIPTVLLNGHTGIGTGWKSDGLNYNPRDVIEEMRAVVTGAREPRPLTPWYDGFEGSVSKVDETWMTTGKWQIGMSSRRQTSPDSIEITELPVRTWTENYKTWLLEKSPLKTFIKDIDTSRNGKYQVNLLVTCDPDELMEFMHRMGTDEEFGRALKLVAKARCTSDEMWLWNSEGKLQLFKGTEEVFSHFYEVRLAGYQRRLVYLRKEARRKAASSRMKLNYLRCIANGTLRLYPPASAAALRETLLDMGFEPTSDFDSRGRQTSKPSFDHLRRLPMSAFEKEKMTELEKTVETRDEELESLLKSSAVDLWLQDLDELEEAYDIFSRERAKKQGRVTSVTRIGKGKGKKRGTTRKRAKSALVEHVSLESVIPQRRFVPKTRSKALASKKSASRKSASKATKNGKPRVLSAYNLFFMDERRRYTAANTDMNPTEVLKAIGAKWRGLEEEEKQKWLDKQKAMAMEILTGSGGAPPPLPVGAPPP